MAMRVILPFLLCGACLAQDNSTMDIYTVENVEGYNLRFSYEESTTYAAVRAVLDWLDVAHDLRWTKGRIPSRDELNSFVRMRDRRTYDDLEEIWGTPDAAEFEAGPPVFANLIGRDMTPEERNEWYDKPRSNSPKAGMKWYKPKEFVPENAEEAFAANVPYEFWKPSATRMSPEEQDLMMKRARGENRDGFKSFVDEDFV